MAKGLVVEIENKLERKQLENFWKKVRKDCQDAEDYDFMADVLDENHNTFGDIDSAHDVVANIFKSDKEIFDDYKNGKSLYELSVKSVQRIIDTVDVTKRDGELAETDTYAKTYHLPKVTEKNKNVILMHFLSNVCAGDAAKGFMDKTCSLDRFTHDPSRDAEFVVPVVPEIEKAKKTIREAEEAQPPRISKKALFLGWLQKKIGMDRDYRRQYDAYLQKKAEYEAKTNVTAERNLVSKFDAVVNEKAQYTSYGYAQTKAEKEKNAKNLQFSDDKKVEAYMDTEEKWNKLQDRLNINFSSLKTYKMDKEFIENVKVSLAEMEVLTVDMKDPKKAEATYKDFSNRFKEAMVEQNKLGGKVNTINDKNLSKKLGMKTQNLKGSTGHVKSGKTLDNTLVYG